MIIGGGYPTGLRRRNVGGPEDPPVINATVGPDPRPRHLHAAAALPARRARFLQQNNNINNNNSPPGFVWKFSHVYCLASALLALLAIITSTSTSEQARSSVLLDQLKPLDTPTPTLSRSLEHQVKATMGEVITPSVTTTVSPSALPGSTLNPTVFTDTSEQETSSFVLEAFDTDLFVRVIRFFTGSSSNSSSGNSKTDAESSSPKVETPTTAKPGGLPGWLRWLLPPPHHHKDASNNNDEESSDANNDIRRRRSWLDPSIVKPRPTTLTDLIDKILTSTPRLLAIANLLLALTYQMHTAVADWFLGGSVGSHAVYHQDLAMASTGRERLGSFLVFKLLLISAVVVPDTLDLLILLSWYTLLSFLRSLAHLAAATTSHTTQSGQSPRSGVLRLLIVVLLSDFVAAAVCVALFQPAGWGMVMLLTCDCLLLAVEVFGHMLRHLRHVLEDIHETTIADMEEQQLQIHARQRRLEQEQARARPARGVEGSNDEAADAVPENQEESSVGQDGSEDFLIVHGDDDNHPNEEGDEVAIDELDDDYDDGDDGIRTLDRNNLHLLMDDSRRLDQAMDVLEVAHSRRLAILDTTIFTLQLFVHGLTVGHFFHIWTLHGIQFTLIDGVLALHLHSALSAATKKIAERRNLHRIARNLDGMFQDASELDLKIASASGDVCCICLGAMSAGSVKKVGCGHLYHTSCLREVVERAHAIEAAKCPLCRASVVDGTHHSTSSGNANGTGGGNNPGVDGSDTRNRAGNNMGVNNLGAEAGADLRPGDGGAGIDMQNRGERALFRFSTEGILPNWMPLPAFSFEVVRRPTRPDQAPPANNNVARNDPDQPAPGNLNAPQNNNPFMDQQQSLFRRLLTLAGAASLSPEEEARALAQLVDMFPQYERADLLRELRDRGSAESVVESVLLGVFSGRARGSAFNDTNANNQANDEPPREVEEPVAAPAIIAYEEATRA